MLDRDLTKQKCPRGRLGLKDQLEIGKGGGARRGSLGDTYHSIIAAPCSVEVGTVGLRCQ